MKDCNYCTFQRIKKRAKKEGKKVTIRKASGPLGGVDIFVHPTGIKPEGFLSRAEYFEAWFMELPDKCACDDDGIAITGYFD